MCEGWLRSTGKFNSEVWQIFVFQQNFFPVWHTSASDAGDILSSETKWALTKLCYLERGESLREQMRWVGCHNHWKPASEYIIIALWHSFSLSVSYNSHTLVYPWNLWVTIIQLYAINVQKLLRNYITCQKYNSCSLKGQYQ